MESKDLDIGRSYHIRSSEQLEYRDSDEWLFTYGITKGDMTLSISFPEPNEDYIETLIDGYFEAAPMYADKSTFDRIRNEMSYLSIIYFSVAWIWDILGNMNDYETAEDCTTWDGLSWDDIFGQKIK